MRNFDLFEGISVIDDLDWNALSYTISDDRCITLEFADYINVYASLVNKDLKFSGEELAKLRKIGMMKIKAAPGWKKL